MNHDFKTNATLTALDFKLIVLINHDNWLEENAPEDIPVRFLPIPARSPVRTILNGIRYSPLND